MSSLQKESREELRVVGKPLPKLDARQKVAGNKIVDATLEVAGERAGKKA